MFLRFFPSPFHFNLFSSAAAAAAPMLPLPERPSSTKMAWWNHFRLGRHRRRIGRKCFFFLASHNCFASIQLIRAPRAAVLREKNIEFIKHLVEKLLMLTFERITLKNQSPVLWRKRISSIFNGVTLIQINYAGCLLIINNLFTAHWLLPCKPEEAWPSILLGKPHSAVPPACLRLATSCRP